MTKQIGIVGWADDSHFGVNKAYLKFINIYGKPIILLPGDSIRDDLDLLILPGGPDIPYHTYTTGVPDYTLSKQCPYRDHFEEFLLPHYIDKGVPVIGICRGHQSLAAMYGCEIEADIAKYHPKTPRDARYTKVHRLELSDRAIEIVGEQDKYHDLCDDERVYVEKVNSLHHQGVITETEDYISLATSGSNHVYHEVMTHKSLPISSVQFHPEELDDDPIADLLILRLLSWNM
jgi:gamma-glutamyl-gamma-aminobutyrate hydrolase PuuD